MLTIAAQSEENCNGDKVNVYLDIFHAVQRITKTIPKRHPLCREIMKDVKLLFRQSKDKGEARTLPTPDIEELLDNVNVAQIEMKICICIVLAILFHHHNQKLMPSSTGESIISAQVLYNRQCKNVTQSNDGSVFGILSKTGTFRN